MTVNYCVTLNVVYIAEEVARIGMGDTEVKNESGEKLSKNELKRRLKEEKKAAEKAEKEKAKAEAAAANPTKAAPAKPKAAEEDISPNEYFKLRSLAVEDLKVTPSTHPYPHKFNVSTSLTSFLQEYEKLKDGETLKDVEVRCAGRIHAIRYTNIESGHIKLTDVL